MKERIYDFVGRALDRKGFDTRRDRLVGELDGDVLEVGAGTGLNIPRYKRAGRVAAVEPDRSYRRRLSRRAATATVPVEVVAGTAEKLPFPDESFDHVVTSIALCSVTDLEAALAEIKRVLRAGGALHFLEHVRGDGKLGRRQDRFTPLQRRLADGCHLNRDATAAVTRAGLCVVNLEPFDMPTGHPLIKAGVQGTAVKPDGETETSRRVESGRHARCAPRTRSGP